jgi:hypothetical protein
MTGLRTAGGKRSNTLISGFPDSKSGGCPDAPPACNDRAGHPPLPHSPYRGAGSPHPSRETQADDRAQDPQPFLQCQYKDAASQTETKKDEDKERVTITGKKRVQEGSLMTRGPQPLLALQEAHAIGSKRGTVMDPSYTRDTRADLTIFCPHAVIFVTIKRTRSHIRDIQDITSHYRREIAQLRRIPRTAVVYCELWVRSQRGSWLFYRVNPDAIFEIRSDGTAMSEPMEDAGSKM